MEKYLAKIREELEQNNLAYLRIKVLPKASQTEFRELMDDDTLKIAIKAPPTDGKANNELVKFLQKEFDINSVKIISGKNDRIKLVKIKK